MKYGSLSNQLLDTLVPQLPKVGDGATLILWSDRQAYTIIDVKKSYVLISRDIIERMDQNFERGPQEYNYQTDFEAEPIRANLRKDGKYYVGDQALNVGYRDEYYDYSF